MKKSRELTSHTYDSDTAEAIAASIRDEYFGLLTALAQRLEAERSGFQPSLFDE